jgi:hypothetical protein
VAASLDRAQAIQQGNDLWRRLHGAPDRHTKRIAAGLESPHAVVGRGFDEPDHLAEAVGLR